MKIQKDTLSPTTYALYEKIISKHLVPYFGRMRLHDIRSYHVQDFILHLSSLPRSDGKEGHLAPQTVKRYTTLLRSMMAKAYKLFYMDDDAGLSRRLTFPKEKYQGTDVFTIEVTKQILAASLSEPINIRLLIETALFTGMRRDEVVGIKWAISILKSNSFQSNEASISSMATNRKKRNQNHIQDSELSASRTVFVILC